MYKHQRFFKKIPSEFTHTVIELIKWRDDTKDKKKARAIQRVIDRKIMWAHEHGIKLSLYMYCAGHGYDLYGNKPYPMRMREMKE